MRPNLSRPMIPLKLLNPLKQQGKQTFSSLSRLAQLWSKRGQVLGKRVRALGITGVELTQEIAKLILAFLKWLVLLLALALVTLPYQIWRVFKPNHYGSQPISRFFRRAFESPRARRILGTNLAAAVLVMSVVQTSLPTFASESKTVEVLPEPQEVLTTETTFRQPVGGYISQDFRWFHPGVDIAGNDNQIIYPVARGTVVLVESSRFGYGNSVVISHNENLASRYAHLSVVKVKQGESVDKNTAVGYVGSTGWSTGPHLHLEIYEQGKPINPLSVLPSYFEE